MGRLDGKVALITGAARGMGESHARLFAKEGAKVIATDRRDKLGEETVASIRTAGGEAIYLSHDVTDERQWQSVIATAVTRYGKIDILVNNAAFAAFHSAEESSLEDWNRVMDVCVKSIFLGCKFILPAMQKAGGGSIVNISSIAGMAVTWRNSPTAAPVVASAATGTSGADPCRPRIGAAPADGLSWRPATA